MKIDAAGWIADIANSVEDGGFKHEAAQIQAKALLSRVVTDLPAFRWTYIPQRIARNISLLTFQLRRVAEQAPEQIGRLAGPARDLAFIWEALGQLREGTESKTALLNAAVAYELAGFQANAASLARHLGDTRADQRTPLVVLTALFLQRRLVQLRDVAPRFLAEPPADMAPADLVPAMATASAAEGFWHTSAYLLGGETKALEVARSAFHNAAELFEGDGAFDAANLVWAVRSLLPVIRSRSTWKILSPYTAEAPRWSRYLRLLARGVSGQPYYARSVVELWPSQLEALRAGLLSTATSKIVKMPTSAGKTRVAELAIVHTLLTHESAKCVYVAPYRALVSELHQSFLTLFRDLGFRVSSVVGTYESDDFEELLFREADLLVTTPEKLDLLLRAQPQFLEHLRLIVLDETQIVDDQNRGMKFEVLLSRLKRDLPNARFVALSAVLPQETLEDFATWLRGSPEQDIVQSSWRPAAQRVARFEWRGRTGVLRFPRDESNPVLAEFVPGIISQREFAYENPRTGRMKRVPFPDPDSKSHVAAELAYKLAETGPVLVFCTQQNFVEAVARALSTRLELSSLVGEVVPHYFGTDPRARSVQLAQDWMGGRSIVQWLAQGIGIHHGMLPDVLRTAIEDDFRQRRLRVLIATNTLAQGVNLPVRTVIVHSCRRYQDDSWQQLPARDYWNIAGRAGRAGEETDGLIVHITLKAQDQVDFAYYVAHRENVEPVRGALFQKLQDLVANRLSPEVLASALDPEIMGILAEEENDQGEAAVNDVIEGSLFDVQARRRGIDPQPLKEVFRQTAAALIQKAPSREQRALYGATGLSSTSCEVIVDHVREHAEQLGAGLLATGPGRWQDLVALMVPSVLALEEMEGKYDFPGDRLELLGRWVGGGDLRSLIEEYGVQVDAPETLGKFIDEFFRYLLPWGIAAYTRLAIGILGLPRESLSEHAKFLPSMVKFGLPDPVACWAMSAGVPYRRAAQQIAGAYRAETPQAGQQDFLEWLARVETERLRYEFGLESPMLDDIARALFLAGDNPLLTDFRTVAEFLPREVEVRGIRYENREQVALQAAQGQRVDIRRDYDNLVDPNAIAVLLGGAQIGYVPRDVAQVVAPEMDAGSDVYGVVTRTERVPATQVWVGLDLERR